MTGTAPERLMGPSAVLNWPSVARFWHPSKSQFQPGLGPGKGDLSAGARGGMSVKQRLDPSRIMDSRLHPRIHSKRY